MRTILVLSMKVAVVAFVLLAPLASLRAVEWVVNFPPAADRLVVAAGNDDLEAFADLLDRVGSPDAQDGQGDTALMMAARCNRMRIARELLSKGANVNASNHFGCTPLMYAALYGSPEMLHLLISHGADPVRRNIYGMTAEDFARMNPRDRITAIVHPASLPN